MRRIILISTALLALHSSFATATDVVDLSQFPKQDQLLGNDVPYEIVDMGKDTRRGVIAQASLFFASRAPLTDDAAQKTMVEVKFINANSGEDVLSGQAAVRVFSPDSTQSQTVRLNLEQSSWRAEIDWPESDAEIMIKVGSKLSDGKKRIYRFFYRPTSASPEMESDQPSSPNEAL